jgi:hypothetical protein
MVDLRDTAFYYPGVIWSDAGWVKSLTLFFDEIALLVPDYMADRPFGLDPAIAEPLADAGLLRLLSPERMIGRDTAERLSAAMTDVTTSGALDNLHNDGPLAALSWSRMGGLADHGLARMLFEELHARGLAQESTDGVSIPMHPSIRMLYLVLLAQFLREAGPGVGAELSPATDRSDVQHMLVELLGAVAPTPGAARVVSLDLEVVAPRLDSVPLDELLAFRAEHGAAYQAYARRLREIVNAIAAAPEDEHERLLADRRAEVHEASEALRVGPMRMLGVAGIGLGIAGGVASAVSGDVVGGSLSAGSAVAGAASLLRTTTTPYSYLFAIQRQFA